MVFYVDLLIFAIACIAVSQFSALLVKSLAKIATFLKINEFTIAFILVAIATSLPETFIGIMSALEGVPAFSIGNVIGSNIIDLTLIAGIGAVLAKKLKVESRIIKTDMLYMFMIALLPVILLVDHTFWAMFGIEVTPGISRIDGTILVLVFGAYMYNLLRQESKFPKMEDPTSKKELTKYILFFIGSIIALVISSSFVVDIAKRMSVDIGITPLLTGIFFIALGTTLPELVFTVKSVASKHESLAIGDLMGSVITNSTLVLGVTAIIHP
ncbi:MAG: sodium:calcium antiporter, partial [Nanoarchaeota archaeon]|nr:sodium:calcium antiporter [Nanoarchaeota archaeon]